MAIFHGTKHDDDLAGTTGDDTFDLFKGGHDTASGGDGDDVFQMGASLDAGDRIDGGADRDVVLLRGDYSAGVVFDDLTIQNIEILRLGAGFDYKLTLADGNVAAHKTLTINASQLGGANSLTFDGSAETDGHFALYGGAGNDTLIGGAKADVFHLENGGNDTAHGGDGNDTFYLGSTFTRDDVIDGGAGHNTVVIEGMGDDAISFAATTMTGIETLVLGAGHFYTLTTDDATVAAGATLTVDATALGAGDPLIFNGSHESDGNFVFAFGGGFTTTDTITGGAGNDTLSFDGAYASLALPSTKLASLETLAFTGAHAYTGVSVTGDIAGGSTLTIDASAASSLSIDLGGAGSTAYALTGSAGDDTIKFGNNFSVSDSINGGGGDDTLDLNSTGRITFTATTITNIETIKLVSSAEITFNDGNVAAGATLTVDASAVTFGLEMDGSAETDGSFHFIAGHGAIQTFAGGGGDDFFDMSLLNSVGALQQGNGGSDTFLYAANFSFNHSLINGGSGSDTLELNGDYASLAPLSNHIISVETLKFLGNHSYNGIAFTGDIAGGSTLILDASAASNISIDLSAATSVGYAFTGSAGGDTVKFGTNFLGSDTVDGGAGNDTLALSGGDDITFGATTLTSIETLLLTGGSFDIATNDGNVASGKTLTVDASGLTGAQALTLHASAETDGLFAITGGAGADSVTFGSHYSVSDSFDGGAGNDTLTLTNIRGTFNFADATINNVEDLVVTIPDEFLATITTTDANVAAGSTMTVDFSSSGQLQGVGITFDGSAETDGHFNIIAPREIVSATHGGDFTGGALSDTYTYGAMGSASIFNGLGGDDVVRTVAFSSGLEFDGGSGNDTLAFTGGGKVDNGYQLKNVENVTFDDNNWTVVGRDDMVAAGASVTVDATALTGTHSISFDGSRESNGSLGLKGGAGNDTLIGGSQADNIIGGNGADTLSGNGGSDTFIYTAAAQSTSTTHDTITDFVSGTDLILVPTTITGIFNVSGSVSAASIDGDLQNLHAIEAQGATVVTVTGGDLNGHTLLVIDGNGDDVYTGGQDYVIDITHYTGTITTGDFI